MKHRFASLGVPLLAALLMVWAFALAPTALAAGTPPKIVGTDPTSVGESAAWGGGTATVLYYAGTSPVVPSACELDINGAKVPLYGVPVDSSYANGRQLQFSFATSYTPPKGDLKFHAVLVTRAGEHVTYDWAYNNPGAAKPELLDWPTIKQWWWYIAKGGVTTVELTVISICFAVVFALFGALGRLSRSMSFKEAWNKYRSWGFMALHTLRMIPYWIATFYTSLFRGTPLLLQIFVIYYAIPAIIDYMHARYSWFNIPYPSAFVSGVAALSLNYGAYLTEVFRAGIQAVPKGQTEAAWALGLSGGQTQRRIVLPQAFKIVIPAVGNDFIALIKDTSLVSTITVNELLHRAQLVGGRTLQFLSALLVAAAVYWILTIFFSFWQARLERRMEHDRARA
jgi:polar amino acid transport system permease protein